MRTFRFLLNDARSPAPQLFHVETCDDTRARELAAQLLARSPHHQALTIWEGGRRLARLAASPGIAAA